MFPKFIQVGLYLEGVYSAWGDSYIREVNWVKYLGDGYSGGGGGLIHSGAYVLTGFYGMSFKRINLSFIYLLLTGDIILSSNVTNKLYMTKSKIFRKLAQFFGLVMSL